MFALSFLIITAIIGAGFATGAELQAFFGTLGTSPILIAIFVGVFFLAIMAVLLFASGNEAGSNKFKPALFNVLYFVFYTAMIAGITELAGHATAILAIVLCIIIVCFGFEKLLKVNYFLTVLILGVLLWVGVTNFGAAAVPATANNIGFTLVNALLYAGMNCCMMEQLFRAARKKYDRQEIFFAILFAVCVVAFFVLLLLTAFRANNIVAAMPVLALNNSFITKTIIFLAVLSSMYVTLFSITSGQKKEGRNLPFMIAISAAAYFCSLFGFTQIIGTVYPIIGAAMIIYAVWILMCLRSKK